MSSKAKCDGRIKSDIVVVGIDVSKRSHVAAIRFPDGGIKKPFSFQNDRQGFERLISRVERAHVDSGSRGTLFALERSIRKPDRAVAQALAASIVLIIVAASDWLPRGNRNSARSRRPS
jgi:hypothetical protein